MKPVQVVSDFFTKNQCEFIRSYVKTLSWKYTDDNIWRTDVDDIFVDHILSNIQKVFYSKYELEEAYAIAYTYGMNECFHSDDKDENHVTVIYSVNYDEFSKDDLNGKYITFDIKHPLCDNTRFIMESNTLFHFKSSTPYKLSGPGRFTEKPVVYFIFKLVNRDDNSNPLANKYEIENVKESVETPPVPVHTESVETLPVPVHTASRFIDDVFGK